jgi:3-dehydroquinate dehydratase/shikimate dehydrogenase
MAFSRRTSVAKLCGVIARKRHEKIFEEMSAARKQGLDLLEIRLDFLNREPRFKDILARRRCPLIATIRRKKDGGLFSGSEDKRRALLRAAIAAGFDYVDVEADVALSVPRYGDARRIVSHHDFDGVPDNLESLFSDLQDLDADVVKIVVKARKASDCFRVLSLLRAAKKPTVAFCMGEYGLPSRLLSAKLGAPFSYAAFNVMRIVAPGMLTVDDMKHLYHFEKIDAATQVYGVVGDPVSQSLSPLVHNACFRHSGLNKLYVPFRVSADDLAPFLKEAAEFPVFGLSVTIPHKEAITAKGTTDDVIVKKSGSANTMVQQDGRWRLFNTDGPAAVEALTAVLPPDPESGLRSLADRKVLLLGAGGAAAGVAAALAEEGASVSIASRTLDRSRTLAAKVGCRALEWEQRYAGIYDVVINATPLGMHPNVQESSYHQSALREGMVVMDVVYHPENTVLVSEAKLRGCRVATGVDMFVRQAEAQFRLFADGRDPPPGLMTDLVREEFSPARTMLREARLKGGATRGRS